MRFAELQLSTEAFVKTFLLIIRGGLVALLLLAIPASADTSVEFLALKSEIEKLKQGQEQINKELLEIRQLLAPQKAMKSTKRTLPKKQGPVLPVEFSIAAAPFLGEQDAPVVLVEFTDYQCPYCLRHFTQTKPELLEEYVKKGKVKYVLREFPIPRLHPKALQASEAALCAGDQGQYWTMHESLFENQKKLALDDLLSYAVNLDLDFPVFRKCLINRKYRLKLFSDLEEGANLGIRGTPAFFLGLADPNEPDTIIATKYLYGAHPYSDFEKVIEELMAQKDKEALANDS